MHTSNEKGNYNECQNEWQNLSHIYIFQLSSTISNLVCAIFLSAFLEGLGRLTDEVLISVARRLGPA